MNRVTLRDLGKKLGLSHTGVSLALRGHASIPKETCERVRALAKSMGYRPDPALASLNAYRQANHPMKYQATLAWINAFAKANEFQTGGAFEEYIEGAKLRADELGYKLEEYHVPDLDHWKRLGRILRARRIEGILIPPPPDSNAEGYRIFPWEEFFAIAVGTSFGLTMHLVVNDQFQSAALAVQRLYAQGYRRIGLGMRSQFATHTEFHFLGGYHTECVRLNIPSLALIEDPSSKRSFARQTQTWIRRERLDAVIASGAGDILPILEEAGLRVPDDIAVVFLARLAGYPQIAAIDQNNGQIGASAANHLIDLIRRNERGIPSLPLRHLIPGTWVDGASAPTKFRAR